MAVDVNNEGIIILSDVEGGITVLCVDDKVTFSFKFKDLKDATAFHNALCASVDVGCVHFHIDAHRADGTDQLMN